MAKIYGLFGAMTGKVADVVMAVRNGEQIARKYQPVVSNPQTATQISARARFKLMSQLSAVFAPYIAIRKVGSVSSRNLFVKENFKNSTFTNDNADIDMSAIKITKSVVGFPVITATRNANALNVETTVVPQDVDRVVYVVIVRNDDDSLRAVGSTVVTAPGTNGTYPGLVVVPGDGALFVYAYGIRDNSETAKAIFGDLISPNATTVARIITSSSLTENDVTLTETRYASVGTAA